MNAVGWKRAGMSAVALVAVVGLAGCQDGAEQGGKKAAGAEAPKVQDRAGAARVLKAAYKKTADAKSAKVRMTMTMPAGMAGPEAGNIEMSGTLGWGPTIMDMTMKPQGGLAAGGKGPGQVRMIMVDEIMYMDMGAQAAAGADGKRWMKIDLKDAAAMGGKGAARQFTGSLENANQDPSQQLGMLLESPNLKHVGAENVAGVPTQHYKGTLTVAEMLKTNKDVDKQLTAVQREQLLANMNKAGIKGYDTDVWVDDNGYPAKMLLGVQSPQGTMKITMNYSDYGAEAVVQTPPAKDTVDFMEMMKELEKAGAGAEGM
ncbi:hypothetical protein [Streptomyces candidus]|uniref:Lipoprotein n=1 Tax=Streptomyces candidus TaxID=67283 RepID=A0A7X0LNI2_9ACTN|nr:hypothetical protein [Streptomyces candidus]MBB6434892.1 hypothetical protein [Streptomyces candidus]